MVAPLDTLTRAAADPSGYGAVDSADFPVFLRSGSLDEPEGLVVEMPRMRGRRAVAFWNGCALKI